MADLSPGDYVQLRRPYKDWWGAKRRAGARGFVGTIWTDVARVFFDDKPVDVLKKDLILLVKGENG